MTPFAIGAIRLEYATIQKAFQIRRSADGEWVDIWCSMRGSMFINAGCSAAASIRMSAIDYEWPAAASRIVSLSNIGVELLPVAADDILRAIRWAVGICAAAPMPLAAAADRWQKEQPCENK